MTVFLAFICKQCTHILSVFFTYVLFYQYVCVLTCAGHGWRVTVSAVVSGVAVAHSRPVSERVAMWRTLGASGI